MRRASLTAMLSVGAALVLGAGCEDDKKLRITKVSPKVGDFHGGERVTIYGSGFQAGETKGVTIYFGDKKARPVQIVGDDQLWVPSPPGKRDQTVDVQLIFDDARQFTYEDAFTYLDPSAGFGVDELTTGEEAEDTDSVDPGGEDTGSAE